MTAQLDVEALVGRLRQEATAFASGLSDAAADALEALSAHIAGEDARVAAAVAGAVEGWPLKARVWQRTSVEPNEWVLEIEGTIGDTNMTCRHTQSLAVPVDDVPGLPELYDAAAIRETPSAE